MRVSKSEEAILNKYEKIIYQDLHKAKDYKHIKYVLKYIEEEFKIIENIYNLKEFKESGMEYNYIPQYKKQLI